MAKLELSWNLLDHCDQATAWKWYQPGSPRVVIGWGSKRIMSENGLDRSLNFQLGLYHFPPFFPSSLPRKEPRRGDPFLETAEFSEQTALLRFLDKEVVRKVESEIFLSQSLRRLLQCSALSVSVGGRELESFINTLTISQLLSIWCIIIRLQIVQKAKYMTQTSLKGHNRVMRTSWSDC